jgi:hypothetical protein
MRHYYCSGTGDPTEFEDDVEDFGADWQSKTIYTQKRFEISNIQITATIK